MDEQPNILFIMTDHQRADSLGMVQAGIEVTPNLNRLMARGTNFSRAYNTSPICVPARTALATGKYPTVNGVTFNDWRGTHAGDHKPMHQYLAEAGYDGAHVGIDHIKVQPGIRKRLDFALWCDNASYAAYLAAQDIDEPPAKGKNVFKREVEEYQAGHYARASYSNTHTARWPHAAEHFKDSYFCQQAVDFLQQPHPKPFALFVYLWAPHPPLRVPEPYASLFDPQALELPANVGIAADCEPPRRRLGVPAQLAEGVSMAQWRNVWAAHLGWVHLADAGIGQILQALERSEHAEQTLTLFASDHGDHLGQHCMYQKMEMYEQAIHVPLIVALPGGSRQTVDTPVSHLDIMPTLLEWAGVAQPNDLDGRSLLTSIQHGVSLAERTHFCQYSGNPKVGDIRRAVITARYKYVYDPADLPELYDLAADPLEMHNLATDENYTAIRDELHAQGKEWAQTHGDWVTF